MSKRRYPHRLTAVVAGSVLCLVAAAHGLSVDQEPGTPDTPAHHAGIVVVKYRAGVTVARDAAGHMTFSGGRSTASLGALHDRHGLIYRQRLLRPPIRAEHHAEYDRLNLANLFSLHCPVGEELAVIAALQQHPDVAYAELNLLFQPAALPQDTYVAPEGTWTSGAWGQPFADMWGMQILQADIPWDLGFRGAGVRVALIDSGVDAGHPDAPARWSNPLELGGVAGFDDDGNGYIDDVHGYDFFNNDADPADDLGHGTHSAGTIAAPINAVGVVGVAPLAELMILKSLPGSGPGPVEPLIQAVQYAAEHGADVISNGYGALGSSAALTDAFHYAHALGCVAVAAAMNVGADAALFTPANIDTVIAVSATDPQDEAVSFSNWGSIIDVSAPGLDILALRAANTDMYVGSEGYVPGSRFVPPFDPTAEYYRSDGTSSSCAHVAGLAAAVLSAAPDLDNDLVRLVLRASADDLGAPGFDVLHGHGRVNAAAALAYAVDCNGNGIPDACDLSCDAPGCRPGPCGSAVDCNANAFPDSCEPGGMQDCDGNGITDFCDVASGDAADCNANGVPDTCDLGSGGSTDEDDNGIPDDCQLRLYVDAGATGNGSGMSWNDAFVDLQAALQAAGDSGATIVEIWVAEGVYTPDEGSGDRAHSFELQPGQTLYGGFAGGEAQRAERDWNEHPAVLSGDLAGNDDPFQPPDGPNAADNSFTVVRMATGSPGMVLDGFVIRGGNGPFAGGLLMEGAAAVVANCTFHHNAAVSGGAVGISGGTPRLVNCLFTGNLASASGGGLHLMEGSAVLTNCQWSGNEAASGGGLFVGDGSATLINCSISDNQAVGFGGGVLTGPSGQTALANCILWNNSDSSGSGLTAQLEGSYDAAYSCLQGWTPQAGGAGNLGMDPLFLDPAGADGIAGTPDDDLRLQSGSPCIDAGDNDALGPDDADLDQDGDTTEPLPLDAGRTPRRIDDPDSTPDDGNPGALGPPIVDMGARERQAVLFVNSAATGADDGRNWDDAFTDLQDALEAFDDLQGGVREIWVAAGTYRPDRGTADRDARFVLPDGLALYGGFSGQETHRGQRDWTAHDTVLSGDLAGDDIAPFGNISDNSCHIIDAGQAGPDTLLDGFVIRGGNADCPDDIPRGGGLLVLEGNPRIANCRFESNTALQQGGALHHEGDGTMVVANSAFDGNRAEQWGGAVSFHHGMLTLLNCRFAGNEALQNGGALFNDGAIIGLINCTLAGNYAEVGGGAIHGTPPSGVMLTNCILWNNPTAAGSGEADQLVAGAPTVSHSCVQGWTGGLGGPGNTGADPQFADAAGPDAVPGTADDNLRLLSGSPCIDAGDTSGLPADVLDLDEDDDLREPVPLDLDRTPRIMPGPLAASGSAPPQPDTVDMGAYEHQPMMFVRGAAGDVQDGTTWASAFRDLQDALDAADAPGNVSSEIWVASDTYRPDRQTADRTLSFILRDGLALYGGFSGIETLRNQRDWRIHDTVLSGDLDSDDLAGFQNITDNSCHVVDTSFTAASAILDGFTIRGGYANCGGTDDYGGGVYNRQGSPTIRNSRIRDNRAFRWGGGMHNWLPGAATLINCRLDGNRADDWGGALATHGSSPTLINCRLSGNQAAAIGGGIANVGGTLDLLNCTLSLNDAPTLGGGVFGTFESSTVVVNSILWGNTTDAGLPQQDQVTGGSLTVDFSCIEGWSGDLGGSGNIGEDPLFVDADGTDDTAGTVDDDTGLSVCSPAIDAGDTAAAAGQSDDLDGDPRVVDGDADGIPAIDMGAAEFQQAQNCCPADLDHTGQVNAPDLAILLGAWGPNPGHDADLNDDGTVNSADLAQLLGSWGPC